MQMQSYLRMWVREGGATWNLGGSDCVPESVNDLQRVRACYTSTSVRWAQALAGSHKKDSRIAPLIGSKTFRSPLERARKLWLHIEV